MKYLVAFLLVVACEMTVIACPDTFYEDTPTYSDYVEQEQPSDEICEFPDECDEALAHLVFDPSVEDDYL